MSGPVCPAKPPYIALDSQSVFFVQKTIICLEVSQKPASALNWVTAVELFLAAGEVLIIDQQREFVVNMDGTARSGRNAIILMHFSWTIAPLPCGCKDGFIRENVHFISACGAAPSHRPTISYAGSTEPEPRRRYWS